MGIDRDDETNVKNKPFAGGLIFPCAALVLQFRVPGIRVWKRKLSSV